MTTILMHIKGLKGNVTIKNYNDWIALDSIEFGGSRPIKMNVSNLSDREHGSLVINRMTLSKHIDNASNDLFMAMCNADSFSQVEIHLCQNDTVLTPYAKFILDNVMVSKHTTYSLVNATAVEEVELAFTKIQRAYMQHDAMNKAQSPHIVGYNLETAKAV